MKILADMSNDERGLLLFFESNAVDHRGTVHSQHMNKDDMDIAKRWDEEGFCKFGRIKAADIRDRFQAKKTHYVLMSDEALKLAQEERIERIKRMGQYASEIGVTL